MTGIANTKQNTKQNKIKQKTKQNNKQQQPNGKKNLDVLEEWWETAMGKGQLEEFGGDLCPVVW